MDGTDTYFTTLKSEKYNVNTPYTLFQQQPYHNQSTHANTNYITLHNAVIHSYITHNSTAYENGELLKMNVIYDKPMPVLYRKDENAENLDGIHLGFGEYAFISDESKNHEFFILEDECWIV